MRDFGKIVSLEDLPQVESFGRMALLDLLLGSEDRHDGNMLWTTEGDEPTRENLRLIAMMWGITVLYGAGLAGLVGRVAQQHAHLPITIPPILPGKRTNRWSRIISSSNPRVQPNFSAQFPYPGIELIVFV